MVVPGPYAGAGNGGGIDPNGNSFTGNGSSALENTGSGGGGGPTGDNTCSGSVVQVLSSHIPPDK